MPVTLFYSLCPVHFKFILITTVLWLSFQRGAPQPLGVLPPRRSHPTHHTSPVRALGRRPRCRARAFRGHTSSMPLALGGIHAAAAYQAVFAVHC